MNIFMGFLLHLFCCGGALLLGLYLVQKQIGRPL